MALILPSLVVFHDLDGMAMDGHMLCGGSRGRGMGDLSV